MRAAKPLRLLVAALLVLSAMQLATAEDDAAQSSSGSDARPCAKFFRSIQGQLGDCKNVLATITPANDTDCPQSCHGLFKDLPSECAMFVNRTLPSSYKGPPAAGAGSEPFDICDRMYCPEHEQDCGVKLDLLRSLDLFRLPYLVGSGGTWNEVVATSPVNVAAIVAGVVVGNAVIVAMVGLALWLRRRHKKCKRVAEMQAPPGLPGVSGSGGSCSDLGTSKMKDPLDSAEMGAAAGLAVQAAKGGAPRGVPISATAGKGGSAYAASDSGASSSRIQATTPPSPFGERGTGCQWVQSAAQGGPAWPPSPPFSSAAATLTDHMQQDELEMMQLGSTGAPGQSSGAQTIQADPLLSWVDSRLAPQGEHEEYTGGQPEQQQQPAEAEAPRPSRQASRAAGLLTPAASTALSSQRYSSGLVDLKPWQLKYSELKMQRPLGEGSFGKVFLATWNETLVAVKVLLSSDDAATASRSGSASRSLPLPVIDELQKEAGLMASLRHPNVVLFLGVCASPPAVVTEYCSRGSLLDVIRAAASGEGPARQQLTWVRRLSMALDAAKGMLCLHAHNPPIVHRDLKSPNLLVDAAWRVKVCDFNLSKLLEDSARSSSTGGMLNPRWLAPEVLMGQPATAASDVFSFGTVLWELLTWQLPWEGANLYQLVFMVSRGERLALPAPEEMPGADQLAAYAALIQRCWSQEPGDRPTFAEAIAELRAIMSRLVNCPPSTPP